MLKKTTIKLLNKKRTALPLIPSSKSKDFIKKANSTVISDDFLKKCQQAAEMTSFIVE